MPEVIWRLSRGIICLQLGRAIIVVSLLNNQRTGIVTSLISRILVFTSKNVIRNYSFVCDN